MKLFIKAVVCSFFITCILSLNGFYGACREIRGGVFRLHILANSDSEEDQSLKYKVRDGLLDYTSSLFSECGSKEEAIQTASDNIECIRERAQEIVNENGYDYPVDAYVTNMSFDTRVYDDFTLPAGEYDALRIVIGKAEGHNWWCVLFPALCINASGDNDISGLMNEGEESIVRDSGEYEVRFKVVEFFEQLCSFFK